MRKIYIIVALSFVASLLLFIASFIYLDKSKHKIYFFAVNLEGHDIGTIKIDRYDTEDRMIYKSASKMPFLPLFTEFKTKIVLDNRYNLINYIKELSGNGSSDLAYLENQGETASFVARFGERFAYHDGIAIKKDAPVTYLPIIDNYDFRKGRVQGFNSLGLSPQIALPPMKRFVTLTSVRDEYLDIDSRRIKAENLLLKIRNYPQGSIWVAKSDRSLVRLEIPQKRLKITRIFSERYIEAREFILGSEGYLSKNIVFKNKNTELAGTLTLPKKEGPHPAVLLIAGSGPQLGDNQGLFAFLADHLSNNGFCVLRFDKRGVGLSKGDSLSVTPSEEKEDVRTALEYLSNQKEVDPSRLALIAHSEGASAALKIASERKPLHALILMAPSIRLEGGEGEFEHLNAMAARFKWSEEYLKLAISSARKTEGKAKASKANWTYIAGKKVFLKSLREELADDMLGVIKKVNMPVLIVQGEDDEYVSMERAALIDKAMGESGNPNRVLTYYGYLNHYFARPINDGVHRIYYEPDKGVLDNIKNWLDGALLKPAPTAEAGSIDLGPK